VYARKLNRAIHRPGTSDPPACFPSASEIEEAAMPFLFWAIAPFELMKAWREAFEIKRDRL
jgi:hypothetical protein